MHSIMTYAVLYRYSDNKDKIAEVRPAHRQYLNSLLQSGNLVAAGPLMDDSGALIIYSVQDETELNQFITQDPFHQQGIFLS
ncbi:MAG TPA: YciI family protein, partial [Gemmatales bacterium]|nr:YciI family protein [Gemmatales bacterium]